MNNLFNCGNCKDNKQCPECKAEQIINEIFNSEGRPLPNPKPEEIYSTFKKKV